MTDECVYGRAAAPGSELAGVHDEIQQLKAAVEVLTNATHLMAIPNANSTLPAEPGDLNPALRCAVLCCAVLCCAVLCCAVLCCAVLCCAVLCCAVLCCAVLCSWQVGKLQCVKCPCCGGHQTVLCIPAGQRAAGEVNIGEVVHGGISTTTPAVGSAATAAGGSLPAAVAILNGSQSAATAVGGILPALPAAATAAAAAIAGLRAPLEGSASKPNAFHSLAGSKQKQVRNAHICHCVPVTRGVLSS